MESLLGFHPPHFSEEAAWLPGWLQFSTLREASNQAFQCPSGQRLEEIGRLQQHICTRGNDNLSDNVGCKSFHLFLSGEDNSTMNCPSCSSNHEIRYHLYLSSNEESQNLSNPVLSKSQQPERSEFNKALIVHHPDSKVTPEETTHKVNNPSRQKGNSGTCGQKNPKHRKVDITDAVELAVAASEALIIHEAVKDEPLSTPLSVLEAAIRVKQARLEEEEVKESPLGFEESNNEVDFLSDLDELTMADAYEDVGLTFAGHCDLSGCFESISHVKDSYGGLEADFVSISSKQELLSKRGIVLESIEGGTHKEDDVDCEVLGTGNVDLIFNCSVEQDAFCMKEVGLQRVGFANEDLTSCQPVLRSSSECNEREDDGMTSLVPDKFQSRWFGGWTMKNEVAVKEDKHTRSIPQLFANETSSLSESADLAPDMNSGIQKLHDNNNTVSQSSVAPPKDTNNGNSLLEDVDISQSSLSPRDTHFNKTAINKNSASEDVDLLCSVVPCSYSSDTNVMSVGPTPQVNLDNTEIVSSPQSPGFLLHEKTRPNLEINNEIPLIHRQVSSLKTYSMLSYPPYDPYLDKQPPTKTPIHNPTSKQDNMEKKTKLPMAVNTEEHHPDHHPELLPTEVCKKVNYNIKSCLVPKRKRVRFSEPEISLKKLKTPKPRDLKKNRVTTLLQNLKFLLTGFSVKKNKEIKNLIQKNGGIVLDDIPSPPTPRTKRCSKHQLPLVLCPKRLLTTKFLYGCAVNACILKVKWLFDSVDEGSILPLKKYMILKEHASSSCMVIGKPVSRSSFVFENIAIMLHGKRDFCTKMAKVVKHGGGLVFKTIHWLVKKVESSRVLVGVIVVEDENGISRQLKQCAVEQNIPVMSFSWIVKSLYAGRVVPSPEFKHQSASVLSEVNLEPSQEI